MADDIPSNWSELTPLITTLIRHLLTVAGSFGFTWALTVTASQVQMAVSALLILAASIWAIVQKIQAMRALKQAAAAPAGRPTPALPA